MPLISGIAGAGFLDGTSTTAASVVNNIEATEAAVVDIPEEKAADMPMGGGMPGMGGMGMM